MVMRVYSFRHRSRHNGRQAACVPCSEHCSISEGKETEFHPRRRISFHGPLRNTSDAVHAKKERTMSLNKASLAEHMYAQRHTATRAEAATRYNIVDDGDLRAAVTAIEVGSAVERGDVTATALSEAK